MRIRTKWAEQDSMESAEHGATLMKLTQSLLVLVSIWFPRFALAADLEGTLRNLVNAFTGRILPIVAIGYL